MFQRFQSIIFIAIIAALLLMLATRRTPQYVRSIKQEMEWQYKIDSTKKVINALNDSIAIMDSVITSLLQQDSKLSLEQYKYLVNFGISQCPEIQKIDIKQNKKDSVIALYNCADIQSEFTKRYGNQ